MASNDKGLEEIPESRLLCFRVQAHTCDIESIHVVLFFIKPCMYPLTQAFLAQIESNYDEVTDSFDSMNLKPELLRGTLCWKSHGTELLEH